MKNTQQGFIGIILVVLIALVAVGGGVYVYTKNQAEVTSENNDFVTTDTTTSVTTEIKTSNTIKDEVKTKQIADYATAISGIDATIAIFNSSLPKFNKYISFHDKLITTLQNEIALKTRIGSDDRAGTFVRNFQGGKAQAEAHKQSVNNLIAQYTKIRQSLTLEAELSAEELNILNTQAEAKQNLQLNLESDKKEVHNTITAFDSSFLIKALGNSYEDYEN